MNEFDNLDNNRLKKVLIKLDRQKDQERLVEKTVPPQDRMLPITLGTGVFFNMLLKSMRAKRVLEVGTSIGYSTLWFADALIQNTGTEKKCIVTIEENSSKVDRARKNFLEAGVMDLIEMRKGDAKKVLSSIYKELRNGFFDFSFIDADKENYIDYFDLVLPLVRVGGIIAADNVLFPKRFRPMMIKYINHIKRNSNVQTVTINIGNGEELSLKTR
jgi:predicted O-methyltransferase YrrM